MDSAKFSPSHKLVVITCHAMLAKELDKEGYWFSELDSLGIHAKRKNDLNDMKEMRDLVENVKQVMFQEYLTAYTE